MADTDAKAFLDKWLMDNVHETVCADKTTAAHLANRCIAEADARGITKAELEAAAGADIVTCIMDAQSATADAKLDELFE